MAYELPGWLTEHQLCRYLEARTACAWALRHRRINETHIKGKILDFGCGEGGSSIYLAQRSDDVTAIDLRLDLTRMIGKYQGSPRRVLTDDGFALMRTETGYDLITAFWLGTCDTRREFVEEFRDAARNALAPTGRVIITSDNLTMDTVRDVFGVVHEGNEYSHYPGCVVTRP